MSDYKISFLNEKNNKKSFNELTIVLKSQYEGIFPYIHFNSSGNLGGALPLGRTWIEGQTAAILNVGMF